VLLLVLLLTVAAFIFSLMMLVGLGLLFALITVVTLWQRGRAEQGRINRSR